MICGTNIEPGERWPTFLQLVTAGRRPVGGVMAVKIVALPIGRFYEVGCTKRHHLVVVSEPANSLVMLYTNLSHEDARFPGFTITYID